MSRIRKLEKNSQGDFSQGIHLVRQIAAVDSGALAITLNPTAIDAIVADAASLATGATNKFSCDGCRTFKLRAWCSTSAATATIDVKEFPYPGPSPALAKSGTGSDLLTRGKGNLICTIAATFSGSTTVSIHPVTGAASGSTWTEMSTATLSYQQDPRVRLLPTAASGATGEKTILIDALGAQWIYPEVSALSAGTIIIGIQRVD